MFFFFQNYMISTQSCCYIFAAQRAELLNTQNRTTISAIQRVRATENMEATEKTAAKAIVIFI